MSIAQNKIVPDASLRDLLNLFKKEIFLSLNCHAIGTIQSFDPAKQTAKITINYKKTFFEANSKGVYNPVLTDYPVLIDCPVIVMRGGNASLTFPIESGDNCLILFNDRDIDNWFHSGQIGPVSTPRLHSFSDGIALIGLSPSTDTLDDYDTTRAVLQNGTTLVGVGADKVKIANTLYTLNGLLQNLITQIEAITVICATPGSASSIPVNAAAIAAIALQIGALLE